MSGPRVDDDELKALVEEGFPIVLQGHRPDLAAPSVDVDNRAGAAGAVGHLIALGHTVIGCITNAPLAYTAAAERLAGYRDALDAAKIPFDPTLVAEGQFDAASGHRAMAELLGPAPRSRPCSSPATWLRSAVCGRCARPGCGSRRTCPSWASTTSRSRGTSIRR